MAKSKWRLKLASCEIVRLARGYHYLFLWRQVYVVFPIRPNKTAFVDWLPLFLFFLFRLFCVKKYWSPISPTFNSRPICQLYVFTALTKSFIILIFFSAPTQTLQHPPQSFKNRFFTTHACWKSFGLQSSLFDRQFLCSGG